MISDPLLWWVILIAVVLTLAFFRASRPVWTSIAGAVVLGFTWYSESSVFAKLLVIALYALPAVIFNLPELRRRLISDRLLDFYRNSMPDISQTERDALEAGSTWWDAELFTGMPKWKELLEFPGAKLSEEERAFIDGPAEELCAMLDDYQIDNEMHDLTPDTWKFIKDKGFFGMIIPKEYGGKGFSQTGHASVILKIATRSISSALTVMIPNSVGPGKLLLRYGTEEQKNYYLPRLASGEEVPCFALTGPEAGSDASAIPDTGVVCRGEHDGRKDVLGIRLNFEKRYITLGPVATVLGLAFKLYDPDGLLGERENLGISLALIPADTKGVVKGNRHNPLHMSFL
ncbi:MAG: acyl-CoA dehydrogenase family protein, partial [Gammaproteobacteria bacterium]|nr:acyl-CoA dehydrogenase family protein [Gammaproteobacteria bacterium]